MNKNLILESINKLVELCDNNENFDKCIETVFERVLELNKNNFKTLENVSNAKDYESIND